MAHKRPAKMVVQRPAKVMVQRGPKSGTVVFYSSSPVRVFYADRPMRHCVFNVRNALVQGAASSLVIAPPRSYFVELKRPGRASNRNVTRELSRHWRDAFGHVRSVRLKDVEKSVER